MRQGWISRLKSRWAAPKAVRAPVPFRRKYLVEALEPRVLLSADLPVVPPPPPDPVPPAQAVDAAHAAAGGDVPAPVFDATHHAEASIADGIHSIAGDSVAPPDAAPVHAGAPTEIAFVDSRIVDADPQSLQRDGMLVVVLDDAKSGLGQISATLAQYHDLKGVHILAHGSAGEMILGNDVLDAGAVAAGKVADWGAALAKGGDLLLYGCDVAAGDSGESFVRALAAATGADVGASTDATGAAQHGGNWDLELTTGKLEVAPLSASSLDLVLAAVNGTGNDDTLLFGTDFTWGDSIDGKAGTDVLDFHTLSLGLTFTITADGSVTISNGTDPNILAVNIESLIGGSGGDSFVFQLGGLLQGSVDGGGGADKLDYSAQTAAVTVDLSAGSASATGGVSNIENVTGGSGDDTFILADDSDTHTIVGGGGADTLDFSQVSSDLAFSITGTAGTVGVTGVTTSATGVENLVGGSGDNTFAFADGATLSGTINGGVGGTNTLSYAAYTTSVTVNLATGTATGTAGISNIQNVTGGSGDDTITGDSNDNILKGGGGNDTFKFADGWGSDTVSNTGGKATLDFSAATSAIVFTVTNTSTVSVDDGSNTVGASNVWSITGGSGDDTYAFGATSGNGIGGDFDGGGGTNRLDYSKLHDNLDLSGTTLNGGLLSVPGIGGTVSNVGEVQHPDTIVTGVDAVFDSLEQAFASLFGGVSLPLIGHIDSSVSDFLGALKDKIDLALATGLVTTNFAKKTDDLIHDAMETGLAVELHGGAITVSFKDLDGNSSFDAFQLDMTLSATIWSDTIPIDFSASVPGLGLSIDGDIDVSLDYIFHFGVGIIFRNAGTDFKAGDYYLVTSGIDPDNGETEEFKLSLSATLPADFEAIGVLGFLQLELKEFAPDVDSSLKYFSDQTDTDGRSGVTAQFTVDVDDPNHDGYLTRTEVNAPGFKFIDQVSAHASVAADVDLRAEVSVDVEGLPHVMTIFHYSQTFANVDISVASGFVLTGPGKPVIAFEDVTLDLGSFLSDFLGPILEQIQKFTQPLQPIVDLLEQDIPIVSDLGPLKDALNKDGKDGVSLLDFAGTLLGDTKYASVVTAIKVLADLVDMINSIPTGDNILINFGDFTVAGGSTGVDATQAGALKNADINNVSGANSTSAFDNQVNGDSNTDRANFMKKLKAGAASAFSVPLISSPSAVLGLLMGQTVDLFKFTLPDLTFAFDFRKSVPIVFPLNAVFFGGVSATVRFAVGFDTRGLQEFLSSGNVLDIFDGFYLDDHGQEGTAGDLPEVELKATIGAGASVGVSGIIEAGVDAGITGTIDFDLNDVMTGPAGSEVGDGKVYFDDLSTLISQHGLLGFIDISGELDWFLEAYVWVGLDLGFFGKITIFDESFDLGSGVIVKFENHYATVVPPDVADLSGGVLNLHMGSNAGLRGSASGDTDGSKDEEFIVDQIANTADAKKAYSHLSIDSSVTGATTDLVVVSYNGYSEAFDASKVSKIFVADAGAGNDSVTVNAGVSANVEIHGGDGDDTVTSASTGTNLLYGDAGKDRLTVQDPDPSHGVFAGAATLFGGDGDDVLTTGAANDFIYGGDGSDKIKSGDGNDWIEGGMESLTVDAKGRAAGDTIDAGKGNDVIYGGTASGAANFAAPPAPTAGFSGSDTIKGGDGNDIIFGGDETGALASGKLFGDTIDGGKGDDQIYGGGGADTIKGGDGADTIYGGDGNDAITGGTGIDQIFGDGKNFTDDTTDRFGNDSINWAVGDGVDSVIIGGLGGASDNDTLLVTGSNADTDITMSNSGGNVLLAWGANNLVLQSFEKFSLAAGTGVDRFVINDLAGTTAKEVSIATGGVLANVTHYDYNQDGTYDDDPPALLDAEGHVIKDINGNTLLADVYADGSPVPYKVTREFIFDAGADSVTINSGDSADQFTGSTSSDPAVPGSSVLNLSRTGTASIAYSVAQSDATRDVFTLNTAGGDDSIDFSAVTAQILKAVTLSSGDGNDTVFGTQFDDTIDSGAGDDRVSGNAGVDTFVDGGGNDILTEVNNGSPTTSGTARTFFDLTDAQFSLDGNDLTITRGTTVETEDTTPFETVALIAGSGANTFTVQNWTKVARLDGGAGSDTYQLYLLGSGSGSITEDDSIHVAGDADQMFVYGTSGADNFTFTADNEHNPLTDGTISLTHSSTVESVHYTHSENVEVRGGDGDDIFVVDDNGVPLHVYGEAGADHFLIGRITASHVDPDSGAEVADAITNGISAESFFYGDFGEDASGNEINVAQSGNDDFEVNHNKAPIWLFGNAGDDRFVVNAVLVQDPSSGLPTNDSNVSGGSGTNSITYLQNAPVNIDGGSGNDLVVVNGTGLGDTFIIAVVDDGTGPKQKVIGAGLQINMKNVERLEVNGAGGDDKIYVFSTLPGLDVEVSGGSGNDTIHIGGENVSVVVDPPAYTIDPPPYTYDPPPFIDHWDSVTWTWGDFWYFDWSFPFWHYQPPISYTWWYPVWVDPIPVTIDPDPQTFDPAPFQFSAGPINVATGIQGKLTIDGGTLDDAGHLGNDTDRIVVHNTDGDPADTLTLTSGDHDDDAATADIGYATGLGMTRPDGSGGTMTGGFYYSNAEQLQFYLSDSASAGDDVTVDYTDPLATTTIFGGQGDDHFRVKAANGTLQLDGGAGNDGFDVWNDSNLLSGIAGTVRINGGTGTDSVDVRDTANTADVTGTLTSSALTGLGMAGAIEYGPFADQTFTYTYQQQAVNAAPPPTVLTTQNTQSFTYHYDPIEALTVSLGSGNDAVDVQGTLVSTTINTNDGNDVVNVSSDGALLQGSLDDVNGALALHLGAGDNTLNVSDRGDVDADAAVTITSSAIVGLAPAAITYDALGGRFAGGVNIWAGRGNDAITVASTLAGDVLSLDANDGDDSVTVASGQAADVIVLAGGQGKDTLDAGATSGTTLVLFGDEGQALYGSATKSFSTLVTVQSVNAGAGDDDSLIGGSGVVLAIGGGGTDTLSGNASNDVLVGDDGEISLLNTIVTRARSLGTAGAGDFLHGGAGKNILIGGLGGDTLDALGDDDVAIGDNGEAVFDAAGVIQLAQSTDAALGGDDLIDVADGRNVVLGGAGADRITGGSGDDVVLGDNGVFTWTGGVVASAESTQPDAGAGDVLTLGEGNNIAVGGAGADSVTSGSGDDIVLGDNGRLTFSGGVLVEAVTTDIADSTGGADVIGAGDGRNVVLGGAGGDTITTGAGDDVIAGDNGIAQFDAAGKLTFAEARDPLVGGDDTIDSGAGNDVIIGGVGGDLLLGGAGNDVLLGDGGTATFIAGELVEIVGDSSDGGNDFIDGGAGSDIMLGGGGIDTMAANFNEDLFTGGNARIFFSHGLVTSIELIGGIDFVLQTLFDSFSVGQTLIVDEGAGEANGGGEGGPGTATSGFGSEGIYASDGTAVLPGSDALSFRFAHGVPLARLPEVLRNIVLELYMGANDAPASSHGGGAFGASAGEGGGGDGALPRNPAAAAFEVEASASTIVDSQDGDTTLALAAGAFAAALPAGMARKVRTFDFGGRAGQARGAQLEREAFERAPDERIAARGIDW